MTTRLNASPSVCCRLLNDRAIAQHRGQSLKIQGQRIDAFVSAGPSQLRATPLMLISDG